MSQLDFKKTGELLKKYKVPYKAILCKKLGEAIKSVKKIKYPIVLKISSPDILHKSDYNLVKTNISNEYRTLSPNFKKGLYKVQNSSIFRAASSSIRMIIITEIPIYE